MLMENKYLILSVKNDYVLNTALLILMKNLENENKAYDYVQINTKFKINLFIKQLFLLKFSELIDISLNCIKKKYEIPKPKDFINNRLDFDKIIKDYKNIIVLTSPYIFKKNQIIGKNIVNIHCGLLPNYRGMMPVFWSLFEGNYDIGYTIHQIDEEIDKGRIIFQKKFTFTSNYRYTDILKKLYTSGAANIFNNSSGFSDVKYALDTYYKKPSLIELLKFKIGFQKRI